MMQASVCSLILFCVLLGNVCLGSETCTNIVPAANVTARSGDLTILPCRLSTRNICWSICIKDNGPKVIAVNCTLIESAVGRYRLDKSSSSCNLVIDRALPSHEGTYNCQEMSSDDRDHFVQLRVTNPNLALKKNTIQSSSKTDTAGWGLASYAVDGNTDGTFNHNSCTHTLNGGTQWWAVDLGEESHIGRVRITNRGDCCPERLANIYIGLTNLSPWTTAPKLEQTSSICKHYNGIPPAGVPTDIVCESNTTSGRYLFVYAENTVALAICELEAYYK